MKFFNVWIFLNFMNFWNFWNLGFFEILNFFENFWNLYFLQIFNEKLKHSQKYGKAKKWSKNDLDFQNGCLRGLHQQKSEFARRRNQTSSPEDRRPLVGLPSEGKNVQARYMYVVIQSILSLPLSAIQSGFFPSL